MNPVGVTEDHHHSLWRLWGEEKTKDAIYSVYLKKVRYHPFSLPENKESNVIEEAQTQLQWEMVQVKFIKAGTLDKLVESLASDVGELESTYITIFLATYRSFATPQKVVTLLLNRYKQLCCTEVKMKEDIKEQHKKTIIQVMHVWLDMYSEDFKDPPQYFALHQVIEFAKQFVPTGQLELRAQYKLDKFKREEETEEKFREVGWCHSNAESVDINEVEVVMPYNFFEIPEDHFALQLTWMDAELFKKLVPYQCLGSVWSRREKNTDWEIIPSTVTATVNQFNAVSLSVMSTVLYDTEMKLSLRASVISKWIDIAQELRFLKNFSSLKAVVAALQCNSIHRLKKVWLAVPREKFEVYNELARIFSEDNNQIICRNLLVKEGSAKFVEVVGDDDHQLQKALQRQLSVGNHGPMQGTIPYLGTFLTDLTMIDAAIPDKNQDGLINFDKKRKEFEVLAQIKLLQSAAKNYNITPDERFLAWFDSVPVIDENESYRLSCLIEPQLQNFGISDKTGNSTKNTRHKKNLSTSSTSTTSSSSVFYDDDHSNTSVPSTGIDCIVSSNDMVHSGSSLSLPLLVHGNSKSSVMLPGSPTTPLRSRSTEFYIIRVSVEKRGKSEGSGSAVYKSIMLSNRDHTRTVIQNALMKHELSGSPDDYSLAQILPEGYMVFPDNVNIFYALNTSYDLNFVVCPKQDDSPECQKKKTKYPHKMKRLFSVMT
ncbi:ral guanine nucleotide dissociation stimulator-like 1 [Tachypleus tridentatus]|uniref:ral guanine nucleotide dissociation stimulator-like 1 n=1 Tax=Tachypleus tridentatus TaxID=6853 RepID=UPI003FD4706E